MESHVLHNNYLTLPINRKFIKMLECQNSKNSAQKIYQIDCQYVVMMYCTVCQSLPFVAIFNNFLYKLRAERQSSPCSNSLFKIRCSKYSW